jgi:hypothetical protein
MYPTLCTIYMTKYGNPELPFVVFKKQAWRWKQVPLKDLPKSIRRANLTRNVFWVEDDSRQTVDDVEHNNRQASGKDFVQIDVPMTPEQWRYEYRDEYKARGNRCAS